LTIDYLLTYKNKIDIQQRIKGETVYV